MRIDKRIAIMYNERMTRTVPLYIPKSRAERKRRALPFKPFILGAVCCGLLFVFLLLDGIRKDPKIAEWWTLHIAAAWETAVGSVTSMLPVSVFELCIIALIIICVWLYVMLMLCLCRAKFKKILCGILWLAAVAVCVLDMYMVSMGFGYYRPPMSFETAGDKYTAEQAYAVCSYFLDDYNAIANKLERDENGCVKCPYTFRELAKKIRDEYDKLDNDYLTGYTPIAKPVTNSWIMSDFLIIGVTFLPTGEANINTEAPVTEYTETIAHELAHAKGVMREGDANLLAQQVLISSDDEFLRYCGYFGSFYSLASAVSLAGEHDKFAELVGGVDEKITVERRFANAYWQSQPDVIGSIGEFFNDLYLKINGANNGTGSYDDGNKSDVITPIDPDTGAPEKDPDTGKPVVIPVYSMSQKMYFALYESKFGTP